MTILTRLGSLLALGVGLVAIGAPIVACNDLETGDDDAGSTCNGVTCTTSQFCLYRSCTAAQACTASTDTTCPSGTVSASCPDGEPGCMQTACAPIVQGCVAIPTACGTDVTCACNSVCGSGECAQVTGINAVCSASS